MTVYQLTHQFPDPEEDVDRWFDIGVFSTRERAAAAIQRLSRMPGFRDHPAGFCIDELEVDLIMWEEGFVSDGPL